MTDTPTTNPRLNPDVLIAPVENGYIAYDAGRDRLHELNMIAALITELCNGERSLPELRAMAAPFVPADKTDEIDRWIEGAVEAGLLVRGGQAGGGQMMDAGALAGLSARLREHGKIQPAYLCARRVVELSPDDAEAWCAMAELAHIAGRRDQARIGYEKYLESNPSDAEVRHILTALRDEAPPGRVPDACIQQLYRNFSAFYENNMVETLGYEGPERLGKVLEPLLGSRGDLAVLDLGCGTGLSGVMLKGRARHLTGVDLSPEMADKARARAIYDRLDVAEITQWLAQDSASYDVIVACDTLIYFGDLEPVMKAVKPRLKDKGLFAFSVERGDSGYRLTDSGRYVHARDHIAAAARQAGFTLLRMEEGFLRMEYGKDVTALFAVLRND
ncbi:MAG TPA: methyltransferase [Rhizomicrobium sp.]|nr:methyltransferase [Rhizomicrobium sp.]